MYFLLTGFFLPSLPGPGTSAMPPLLDLSADSSRQVIVAEGTPHIYNGQPTTALMPDGTFVATTYIKYKPGESKNSIVSTRFSLTETDQLFADRSQQ